MIQMQGYIAVSCLRGIVVSQVDHVTLGWGLSGAGEGGREEEISEADAG